MKFGLLICSLLMCLTGAFADNGQSPLTPPKATFFNNGVPASGYKVCTYAAGTTTPLATYVAFSSGTTNTNPVILDSQGRANIWLGSSGYKIVLMTPGTDNTCSTGTVVTSTDNVGGFCPLQGCTFNGNIHLVGANFLAISSSNATAATIASTATSGGGVNAIASGTGNTIGVLGQVTSTLGIGVLAISGGDIFAGQNAGFSTVFRVANNGAITTGHGIAINGATEITSQSGTGGTVAMTTNPTLSGVTVASSPAILVRVDLPHAEVALVNGANNNVAMSGSSFIHTSGPTGVFNITGFSGGEDGRVLHVYNAAAFAMTITNDSASSSAGNRILTLTGADVTLRAGLSAATFIYDTDSSHWILISTN